MGTMSQGRGVALAVVAAITFALVMGTSRAQTQTVEARWELHERASATTPFIPGGVAADNPGPGYEIISFDAVPLATGLDTYMYGGADLPAERGGPVPAIIQCEATFTTEAMNVGVVGAYPYTGCVFFVGVENTGSDDMTVSLGGIDEDTDVMCDAPGCQGSDIEVIAGGPDTDTIDELCLVEGAGDQGVANIPGTLNYTIAPGFKLVCPLFVTVLQAAFEGSNYMIWVIPSPTPTPPLVTPTPTDTPTPTVETPTPTPTDTATPTETPTGTPTPPTATPTASATETPVSPTAVAPALETPAATPVPPGTGSGLALTPKLVVEGSGSGNTPLLTIFVLFVGGATMLAIAWPRRRDEE